MDRHLAFTMSISREEFLRLLPGAVGSVMAAREDGTFRGTDGPRSWSLRLVPLGHLSLGSMKLARHRIELQLKGYSEVEAEAFLARFQRGFQRGGG